MRRLLWVLALLAATVPAAAANPGTLDLVVNQGGNWAIQCALTDSAGAAVDLTSYSALCQVRQAYNSATVLATITVNFTNRAGGIITLTLDADTTAALPALTGVWDLFLVEGSNKYRILMGKATILPRVSR